MTTLPTNLRNDLSRVVVQARELAEAGARVALEALAVHHHESYTHMDMEARKLRNRLRAHGRQLGDRRDPRSGAQAIWHLVEEFAYEHWHRMLFARFLAENDLLIHPEHEVAITLDECRQLAREEGTDQWTLAGRYAQRMLPQIFRVDHPVFQVDLARNDRVRLERLLESLPGEVFQASDSLGWVYQFWQVKKKKEVNASEVKIGANELPAVTQLFTEPYMVHFLLDNSLGAWWAARKLSETDLKSASSEDELRSKAAIPGVPLDYLRFVQQEDGVWTPAAGTFDGWPEHLGELKTLDPCCGSGHFLVAVMLMLVPMRMELEGLSVDEAVDAVLHENIHGLELDQRCVELAAFSLALTAWKYPGVGGYRPLPELNVACSGLAISVKKENWLALAGEHTNLRLALEELYQQFKDAPVLGSLINPEASLGKGSLFELKWQEVGPLLTKAIAGEKDEETAEMGVVAKGVARSASLLSQKYTLTMTNVPYLGIRKQSDLLRTYIEKHYEVAKHDLANVFLERLFKFYETSGTTIFVSPVVWFYLNSYREQREIILTKREIDFISKLGTSAFDTISGEVVNVALCILSAQSVAKNHCFGSLDVSNSRGTELKARALSSQPILNLTQEMQLNNPDFRIILDETSDSPLLDKKSISIAGIQNGDSPRFLRNFWEIEKREIKWWPIRMAVNETCHYGGMHSLIDYDMDGGHLRESKEVRRIRLHDSDQRGKPIWGKRGLLISRMGRLPVSIYNGGLYDQNSAGVVPNNADELLSVLTFCESNDFNDSVRKIDSKVNVTNATLIKVPFDIEHWTKVAEEKYPNGLPKPYSDSPTQWVFHGHPCGSVVWDEEIKWTAHGSLSNDDTVLQVAVARLLGYRWPAELDAGMELADEQRECVNRCEPLLAHADDGGIVCLPPINRELPAHERLLSLLQAAWGDDWHPGVLSQLLEASGCKGKSLEVWLRDKFFEQHCKLFQHRPFIWHIWDGLHDGFSALVNYHKLDKETLDRLIYSYLGRWIRRQEAAARAGEDGAEERLAAAKSLKERLEAIKTGEAPTDIFVRWKPIEEQPIGWNPDLNDGVRLNIRPFLTVDDVGRKGAGVLRWKPNIHWKKDRGKDVVSTPWYPVFQGDRINDHHLSLEDKKAARTAKDSAG